MKIFRKMAVFLLTTAFALSLLTACGEKALTLAAGQQYEDRAFLTAQQAQVYEEARRLENHIFCAPHLLCTDAYYGNAGQESVHVPLADGRDWRYVLSATEWAVFEEDMLKLFTPNGFAAFCEERFINYEGTLAASDSDKGFVAYRSEVPVYYIITEATAEKLAFTVENHYMNWPDAGEEAATEERAKTEFDYTETVEIVFLKTENGWRLEQFGINP